MKRALTEIRKIDKLDILAALNDNFYKIHIEEKN